MALYHGRQVRHSSFTEVSLRLDKTSLLRSFGGHERDKPAWLVARELFEEIAGCLSMIFLSTADKGLSMRMCENYGHVIQGQPFTANGVHCRDCGAVVTNHAQLRRSLPLKPHEGKIR